MEEKDIYNEKLPIEQKIFFFDLKTTPQGEYLKITEKRHTMRNTIKVPANGLNNFRESLEKVISFLDSYESQRE
ncbi:MAG: DNA-binding protein [Spirochaetes bacterium]|nr:DNA-binding protein [Spirochaetota bacterium]